MVVISGFLRASCFASIDHWPRCFVQVSTPLAVSSLIFGSTKKSLISTSIFFESSVNFPLFSSLYKTPDKCDTAGIDLLIAAKLKSINLALIIKSSLSGLIQDPGMGKTASADFFSDQLSSRSCNSPSACEALTHSCTFLERGRFRANETASAT